MAKVKFSRECLNHLFELNRHTLAVILLLGAFTFFHGFKPSDPYMVQIVEARGISNEHYYNDVFCLKLSLDFSL